VEVILASCCFTDLSHFGHLEIPVPLDDEKIGVNLLEFFLSFIYMLQASKYNSVQLSS
jgi:hypothetical protein